MIVVSAPAVKPTSKGPVFYLAERIGLAGKPFRMMKFRTIPVDGEQCLAEVAALNEGVGRRTNHVGPNQLRTGAY